MQKIANLIFIVVILLIATILPLNTAIMNLNLNPYVDEPNIVNPIVAEYNLICPESKYGGEIGFGKNPLNEIALQFSSSTGLFEEDFRNKIDTQISVKQGATTLKTIKLGDLDYTLDNGNAKFTIKKSTLSEGLEPGYYNIIVSCKDKLFGWNLSTINYNKKLAKTLDFSELSANQTPRAFYIMDSNEKVLIPIYRIKNDQIDYIAHFNELKMGASDKFKLKKTPTMADSFSYWIESDKMRIDFTSQQIKDFKNKNLLFESVMQTFSHIRNMELTVNIDGKEYTKLSPENSRFYHIFTNDSNYMFIVHKPFDSSGDFEQDVKSIYKFLRDENIAPIGTDIISATLNDGIANIEITKDYLQLLNNTEYQNALKYCIELSVSTLDNVEKIIINGEEAKPLAAINVEP